MPVNRRLERVRIGALLCQQRGCAARGAGGGGAAEGGCQPHATGVEVAGIG
jgi:hypothetical protein